MDEFEKDLKKDFLEEASQNLDDCEQAFLSLEHQPRDEGILNQIFRLAHNIKGTSRAVGFGQVAEFTHHFETLILKIKNGEVDPSPKVISLLLTCNDQLRKMVVALKQNMEALFDNNLLIQEMEGYIKGQVAQEGQAPDDLSLMSEESFDEPPPDSAFPETPPLESAFSEPSIPDAPVPAVAAAAPVPVVTAVASLAATASTETPEATPTETPATASANNSDSIRVNLSKVEKLSNLIGELVILQSFLNQHRENTSPSVSKGLSQLSKLTKEIHEMSMGLRMVPIRPTLQKMNRIVRDTSQVLGKDVQLICEGEDTEIDKTVLEKLADPLTHIVRNAVDHGLETPAEREARGKNPRGIVRIRCFHEGNNLIIEVSDDGKGIDSDIIREKAIKKGVLNPKLAVSKQELINLIFHPGFSTKDQVSEISGRGVGMDVVKTNIQSLSGRILVSSEVGKGSVFKISLPLTLAVIDGLVIRIGKEKYVFPLSQVHETLRPQDDKVTTLQNSSETLSLRGKVMPLYRLGETLKRVDQRTKVSESTAIITRASENEFGVLVDEIFHQQQVVVKNLGPEIRNKKGFMGSSILGDGKPALIIDLHTLYETKEQGMAA